MTRLLKLGTTLVFIGALAFAFSRHNHPPIVHERNIAVEVTRVLQRRGIVLHSRIIFVGSDGKNMALAGGNVYQSAYNPLIATQPDQKIIGEIVSYLINKDKGEVYRDPTGQWSWVIRDAAGVDIAWATGYKNEKAARFGLDRFRRGAG